MRCYNYVAFIVVKFSLECGEILACVIMNLADVQHVPLYYTDFLFFKDYACICS